MLTEAVSSIVRKNNTLRNFIRSIIGIAEITEPKGLVRVGEHTYFDGGPKIFSWGKDDRLIIGKYCMFAYDVFVLLGGEHYLSRVSCFRARAR